MSLRDISSTHASDFSWAFLGWQLMPCWKRSDVISPILVVAQKLALYRFGNFLTFKWLYFATTLCARHTNRCEFIPISQRRVGCLHFWWKICIDVLGKVIWEPRCCDFISESKWSMTEYENMYLWFMQIHHLNESLSRQLSLLNHHKKCLFCAKLHVSIYHLR